MWKKIFVVYTLIMILLQMIIAIDPTILIIITAIFFGILSILETLHEIGNILILRK